MGQIAELEHEIERLRAALTEIANDDYSPDDWGDEPGPVWQRIAKRALKPATPS